MGPKGSIELDHGVIVAKRHIHMTPVQAVQMNVKDNDEVFVIMESYERSLIFACLLYTSRTYPWLLWSHDVTVGNAVLLSRMFLSFGLPPLAFEKCLQSGENHANPTGLPLQTFTGSTSQTFSQ